MKIKKPSRSSEDSNRDAVIQLVFDKNFKPGAREVPFSKQDILQAIAEVGKRNPAYVENNVPDVRYQYASGRKPLPQGIDRHGPWMIAGRGKGKYAFVKLSTSTEVK